MTDFKNFSNSRKLIIVLNKVKQLIEKDTTFDEKMDLDLKNNLNFILSNFEYFKDQLSEEMLNEIVDPFIPALTIIFEDLSTYFKTELEEEPGNLSDIDNRLSNKGLSIDEINQLLDKRLNLEK